MKTLSKIIAVFIMMNIVSVIVPTNASAQTSVSFQVFYDDLSPHGSWVSYPDYGYVWIPNTGPEFTPYSSNGHWVSTEYGWTWVSNYSWGWAPFHYGRWAYDPYYGWFWVPDNVWGPAWVTWRTSPGYYGWAPLEPGISFSFAIGGAYNPPINNWVFVDYQYMGRPDIYNYYGPRKNNVTYINNSTVINNVYIDKSKTTYISGPKREDVEKHKGSKITQVSIKENSKHGQSLRNNELTIYKPEVNSKGADMKPAKVSTKDDIKPVGERKVGKQTEGESNSKKPIEKEKKVTEPKKEVIPQKEKKTEQAPKKVEPKMKENKKPEPQPYKEQKKREQSPINENKKPSSPYNEPKKQEQRPNMNQPKMNENKSPMPQPNQGQQHNQKKPR